MKKSLGRCVDGHVNVAEYGETAACGWAKVSGKWVPPSKLKGKAGATCGKPLLEWALREAS